jgi:hypothetical protein
LKYLEHKKDAVVVAVVVLVLRLLCARHVLRLLV